MEERKEKFTPGPWYIRPREVIRYQRYGDAYTRTTILDTPEGKYKRRHVIAQIARGNGREEANAALIAAAPEMYALLDKCESALRHWLSGSIDEPMIGETENTINEIQELLTEARGEN